MGDEYHCEACGQPLQDFKPKMCCSSFDCGCRGLPVEPPVCSEKCWDSLKVEADYDEWANKQI